MASARSPHHRSSGSRCARLALAPWFLRAICPIPSFGITKFAVNARSPDTNKNANKRDGYVELLRVFSTCRENIPENRKAALRHKLLLLLMFSAWCPWPESNQHSLRNSILSRARLPVPPQGHSRWSRPKRGRGREARRTITGGPSRSTRADVIVPRLDSGIFARYDPD